MAKKKIIKQQDIKAITKQFSLTDEEVDYIDYLSEQINKEETSICEELQSTLLYGSWSKTRCNVVNALIIFFGKKIQQNEDFFGRLNETCWKIGEVLKCGSYQVMEWFRSMAMSERRFSKFVTCSDRFGLNSLMFE